MLSKASRASLLYAGNVSHAVSSQDSDAVFSRALQPRPSLYGGGMQKALRLASLATTLVVAIKAMMTAIHITFLSALLLPRHMICAGAAVCIECCSDGNG